MVMELGTWEIEQTLHLNTWIYSAKQGIKKKGCDWLSCYEIWIKLCRVRYKINGHWEIKKKFWRRTMVPLDMTFSLG
jgi:hypothetical protein